MNETGASELRQWGFRHVYTRLEAFYTRFHSTHSNIFAESPSVQSILSELTCGQLATIHFAWDLIRTCHERFILQPKMV